MDIDVAAARRSPHPTPSPINAIHDDRARAEEAAQDDASYGAEEIPDLQSESVRLEESTGPIHSNLSYAEALAQDAAFHVPEEILQLKSESVRLKESTVKFGRTSETIVSSSSAASGFNPNAMFPVKKAILKISGDLDEMCENWTTDEIHAGRRIVRFERTQTENTINASFEAVAAENRRPHSICISCIWWKAKQEHFVTQVDAIYLLENLVGGRFTVEEKNRIRRNLEGFRPLTVSKSGQDSLDFFKLIMSFPNPKPRSIEKDCKVFPWKILAHALKKILGKYSASYNMSLGAPLSENSMSPGRASASTTTKPQFEKDLMNFKEFSPIYKLREGRELQTVPSASLQTPKTKPLSSGGGLVTLTSHQPSSVMKVTGSDDHGIDSRNHGSTINSKVLATQYETSSPGSDTSSNLLIEEIDHASSRFIKDLGLRLASLFIVRNGFPVSCPSSEETQGSPSQLKPANTPTTSQPSSSKRTYSGQDDAETNDETPSGTTHTSNKRRKESKAFRLFACPYCKYMPARYSERNQEEQHYRRCISIKLDSITRLKQHLKRTHSRPDFYCGICFAQFKTREQFFVHQRQIPPCQPGPIRFEEKMTDEQLHVIKVRRFENTRASWYEIFRILFPGAPEPESPYVTLSDPVSFQNFVEFFRWYGPEQMLDLVRDRRDRPEQGLEMNAPLQMLISETFEVFEQTLSDSEQRQELQQRQSDMEPSLPAPEALEADAEWLDVGLHPPAEVTDSLNLSFQLDEVDWAFEDFISNITFPEAGNGGALL